MAKRKPTPKPLPRQAPKPAPIDLVRNPNFDAAMAQKNYDNFIAEQRARMEMERGSVPLTQSEIDKKYVDDGQGGRVLNPVDAAKLQLQFDQLRANNARMGGTQDYGIDYIEGGQRYAPMPQQIGGNIQDDIARRNAALTQYAKTMQAGSAGYMPVDPNTNAPSLMPIQTPQGQQGAMASQYQNPQSQQQQMQNYQNFLQQGMQNSNTMNQGAMNNFANLQPGVQATQTASTTTPNQTMPVAGMGMQKPKQTPPRNFSTVSNSPARFG